MRIRRTRYGTAEQPISLAFISDIAGHPEFGDDAPPPPPPAPPAVEREPRWTGKLIRRALGRDRKHTAQLVKGSASRQRCDGSRPRAFRGGRCGDRRG